MVLDANVVIALLDEGDGLHERAFDLIARTMRGTSSAPRP